MHRTDGYFIGLISGTSMDAVDAAVIHIADDRIQLKASHSHPIPSALRKKTRQLCHPGTDNLDTLGYCQVAFGRLFADAVKQLLQDTHLRPDDIIAIGCHGQTVRHRPGNDGFSLQLGSGSHLASFSGIDVICDFRQQDMALGGEGAPLAPRFHQVFLSDPNEYRGVLNLGGIANVTLLKGNSLVAGFDTGPANTLLDLWCRTHRDTPYDDQGHWAASGCVIDPLLASMLTEPYFRQSAPKSTGLELFNRDWLQQYLKGDEKPEDVQASLLELTTQTVASAIDNYPLDRLLVCGGGAHNHFLLERLQEHLKDIPIESTHRFGIDPDWIEAATFAWLAWAWKSRVPGNAPKVTGARQQAVLGCLYPAP